MSPVVWGCYAGGLVLANVIFWSLPRELGAEDESIVAKDRWKLSALVSVEKTDLELLLASGFWGDASRLLSGGTGVVNGDQATPEVETAEANKLRAQVKAIIKSGPNRQVLFAIKREYVRVSAGEQLPNTDWQLVEAGEDWLKLSKEGGVGGVQLLRLFNIPAKD